uniref:RNA-directed DNA polymerase n=1 Tax=Cacao swollen shoot virus TaxID=31559 RepID=A0A6G8IUT2_9VIRU|nr:ORF3 polyprotein [Cacao swollen shoot virus]
MFRRSSSMPAEPRVSSSRTMEETTTGTTNVPTYDDQLRSYRNGQRRRHNIGRSLRRLNNRLHGRTYEETLEQEVAPETTLRLSMRERARLVPAEVLYHSRTDDAQHGVYNHRSEEAILCTTNQVDRSFIQNESMERLQQSNYAFIHIGILQVRIQTLHRQQQGTTALVVFRDTRWEGDRAIFAQMEVDLTRGSRLVYAIPDTMMTIRDFCRHVHLSILTRGYEQWQNGEANLLVTRGMVGRLSNTSNVGFAYSISGVTDYLTTHGVRAIQGKAYSASEVQGRNWFLQPVQVPEIPLQPQQVTSRNLLGGVVSLRFSNYTEAPEQPEQRFNSQDEEVDSDEEQIIAIMIGGREVPDEVWNDDDYWTAITPQPGVPKPEKEIWDTLGQPSGKYDFMVKYTAPKYEYEGPIVPTGWGDEFEDEDKEEKPEGPNPDEESDSDISLEYPLIIKDEEEIVAAIEEEEDRSKDYPALSKLYEELRPRIEEKGKKVVREERVLGATSATSGVYDVPLDTAMTPPAYAPATAQPERPTFEWTNWYNPWIKPKGGTFRRQDGNEYWTLPPAQLSTGAMFVIPNQLSMFDEVFLRWESLTKNYMAQQVFNSGQEKADFIENLLGEKEKLIWIAWRMVYQTEYTRLVNDAEGNEGIQNILSQIRRVFTLQDPTTGSTAVQDEAYRDLERLQCRDVKDITKFLNDYLRIAAKTGRMYIGTELSEKLWLKLPGDLGQRVKTEFDKAHPGVQVGVPPRILFTYKFLEKQCKEAAFQRSLKSLDFCKDFPIPGYYQPKQEQGGRHTIRRSRTYKGKPHDSHVRVEKKKYLRDRKCKCFLCGEEGHFAKECTREKRNIRRVAMFEAIELPEDHEVVSVDEGDPQSDGIYSVSDNEDTYQNELLEREVVFMMTTTGQKEYFLGKSGGYLPLKRVTKTQYKCEHDWNDGRTIQGHNYSTCTFCGMGIINRTHVHCPRCLLTSCSLCAPNYIDKELHVPKKLTGPSPVQRSLAQSQASHILWLEDQNAQLKREVEHWKNLYLKEIQPSLETAFQTLKPFGGGEKKPVEDFSKNTSGPSTSKLVIEKPKEKEEQNSPEEEFAFLPFSAQFENSEKEKSISPTKEANQDFLLNIQEEKETKAKVKNNLFNMEVTLEILGYDPIVVKAILDTGASVCCIDQDSIPAKLLEENSYVISFTGVNSVNQARKRLKTGKMRIGNNTFRIPFTYAFPMKIGREIQFIIGCNFIRSMQGGIRIEGNSLTFYKFLTTVETQTVAAMIEEEPMEEADYLAYLDEPTVKGPILSISAKLQPIIQQLKEQGFIGEDPLKHWQKNRVLCYLDIKNPDLTIQDKPLADLSPAQKENYKRHIDALLKIGVIRPSTSRHRTNAFIVHSGTIVDPVSGKETKGKERMVFNYKRLNDLTHKDQYSLPGIQSIIAKVSRAKIFSKFDLKAGFHQVAMHPESIPWTAFWVPQGLYEWLVMPFGLKNAPAIFQRKMDNCFKGTEGFIAVYIDDILVFSENEAQHEQHLGQMLEICKKHGLVLSPTKMKIGQKRIEFLGAIIDQGQVSLQENILKKICNVDIDSLTEKKKLRSWLGLLNYARPYMKDMGKLLGPLYAKVSPNGEKHFNKADRDLIKQILNLIRNLPPLDLPPAGAHIVIESDGCMSGWGGVCKWKPAKSDPKRTERICSHASGSFHPIKSTIDAEIHAVMNSLHKFRLYYISKETVTVRTDCQAIISFFNKSNQNKPSRIRWVNFCDYITGTGVEVEFEHIKGEDNLLADQLSRLVNLIILDLISTPLDHLDQALKEHQQKPSSWSQGILHQALQVLVSSVDTGKTTISMTENLEVEESHTSKKSAINRPTRNSKRRPEANFFTHSTSTQKFSALKPFGSSVTLPEITTGEISFP